MPEVVRRGLGTGGTVTNKLGAPKQLGTQGTDPEEKLGNMHMHMFQVHLYFREAFVEPPYRHLPPECCPLLGTPAAQQGGVTRRPPTRRARAKLGQFCPCSNGEIGSPPDGSRPLW
eukprot:424631-Pyramimonas_sp.AAC.1